jgi:hypothetical protein
VIAEALNKILLAEDMANNSNMLAEAVEAALRQDSVSTEEIGKFLALPKVRLRCQEQCCLSQKVLPFFFSLQIKYKEFRYFC